MFTRHETTAHRDKKTVFNLFETSTAMAMHHKANGSPSRWGSVAKTQSSAIEGDMQAAAISDAFMSKFEDLNLVSTGFETKDDVVGAVPNIGAFLTGSPMNMRLRRRTSREAAPLAIVCDLTTSAGISKDDMSRRGSVILAAVRILSTARPVELWTFVGLGHRNGGAVFTGSRIETTPMDLARAAPVFADALWARGVGYSLCHLDQHGGANGSWPYNGRALEAAEWDKVARLALPHLGDTLAIPALHLHDQLVTQPEKWLRNTIATYHPQTEAA